MRKAILIVAALCAAAFTISAVAATFTVNITPLGVDPSYVSVREGDNVVFRNMDTVQHRLVVNRRPNCSFTLTPGQTGSCTFPNAGTFQFRDPDRNDPAFRGTVEVVRGNQGISLNVSRSTVIHGGSTRLTGTVAGGRAGQTVRIVATPSPTTEDIRQTTTTVQTGADGTFTLVVAPRIFTTYSARVGNTTSNRIQVAVRPRLSVRRVGPRRGARATYSIVATAGVPLAGRRVSLNRCIGRSANPCPTQLRLATLRANPNNENSGQVRVTVAVRRTWKLRAIMTDRQVPLGYVRGQSNFIAA